MRFGEYSARTQALERWYHTGFGFVQGWSLACVVFGVILPDDSWQRMVPVGCTLLALLAWRLTARAWKRAFRADIDSWSLE